MTAPYHDNPENLAALYGLVKRAGGLIVLKAEELPAVDYAIMRRLNDDGSLEVRVADYGEMQ